MKGLILCAGKGTRLRPLTHTNAKQLVPVANKPILYYGLEAMRDAGITDIGIVVGDTENEIRDAVGTGDRWGIGVTYIKQDEPRGIAHAVHVSEKFIGGSPFVLYLGDNLLRDGIRGLVEEFNARKPNATILLAEVEDPRHLGVAEVKNGRIVGLEEKPAKPKSNLAVVGVYIFDRNILDAVKRVKPSKRGELEITDSIALLLKKGLAVNYHVVTGWWKDTGKKDDILDANRIVLENLEPSNRGEIRGNSELSGRLVIEEGAVIDSSTVRGPAVIGRNTRVEHSYVGPFTSIEENVIISHSEVENSIIMCGSRIENLNVRLEESLIGRDAVV
ncbi:MAG: glucose-1-phosphate thymidylyltransferase, partial [bacterium]